MNKLQVTTKIWQGTLDKIRVASGLSGKSQVQFIDEMVNFWLSVNGYNPDQVESGEEIVSWTEMSKQWGNK